ncbi:MAG: HAMP domain-containing histidine kinase [Alphaproteobacteria bacterium]|nr:HAMP domain-containing histidine kinase [Alphaproteobacteria bacterium]
MPVGSQQPAPTPSPPAVPSGERTRVELAARTLKLSRLQNPLWGTLMGVAFAGFIPQIGTGLTVWSWIWIASTWATGAFMGIIAWALARYPDASPFGLSWAFWVTAAFGISGVLWGVFGIVFWESDNPVNQLFILLAQLAVINIYVTRLMSLRSAFLAGALGLAGIAVPHLLIADSPIWFLYLIFVPLWVVLTYASALTLSGIINELITTRNANESLMHELTEARDRAFEERRAAEAASTAKSRFLANMSHELRTPLNAILGFAQLIRDEAGNPARYPEYGADIYSSGAHLLSLINDILDISKIESGRMEISPVRLDAKEAIQEALRLIESKMDEKQHQVALNLSSSCPTLYADERAVRQILLNLLSNAIKFTPAGGRIQIAAGADAGGGVWMSVTDNGPGIEPERLATLFKPFERGDNSYTAAAGGTGLGLALVESLVRLHGGSTSVQSEVEKGSIFTVRFPAAPARASSRAA